MMNDKLLKLLTLALNEGAEEGEWHSAALKFIGKLRQEGVKPEEVNIGSNQKTSSFGSNFGTRYGGGFSYDDFFANFQRRQAARAQAEAQRTYAPPPPPSPASCSDFRMPFGKYKGQILGELPPGYLSWLNTWLQKIDGFDLLKIAVQQELILRNVQYA